MDDKILDKLVLLKSLLDEGVITEEEFTIQKKALLEGKVEPEDLVIEEPVFEDVGPDGMVETRDADFYCESQSQEGKGTFSPAIEEKEKVPNLSGDNKNRHHIGLLIVLALIAIGASIGYLNRIQNTIINEEDFKVYNRGGAIYYKLRDETERIIPNKDKIDVIFLSYENGKLCSKTVATPVSNYINKNYNHDFGVNDYNVSLYDNDDNDIVYITDRRRPEQGLVYFEKLKQYYHVNSLHSDWSNIYLVIPSKEVFDSRKLDKYFTSSQKEIFEEKNLGQEYRAVTIDDSGKAKLTKTIGYVLIDFWGERSIEFPEFEADTKEKAESELITSFFYPAVRREQWRQWYDEYAALDKDFLFNELKKNRVSARQEYIDGEERLLYIEANNISSSYDSRYKYYIAEYGRGFTVYSNDDAFARLTYPTTLVVFGKIYQMDLDDIVVVDGEYWGTSSDMGINTYDGMFLGKTRVKRFSYYE